MSRSIVVDIMYTIGEFAALTRVSARMLRHYDAMGLLRPARVDDRTGYRSYTIDQLPRALRIAELRDLGVGLERIAGLHAEGDEDAALRTVLAERHRELSASVDEDRRRLARIERRLCQLEGTTMPDVVYAELAPVTVYATDGVAPGVGPENVSPMIGPLIDRLDRALAQAGRRVIEPGIFWYEPRDDDRLGVYVAYTAEADPVPGVGYDVVTLPPVPLAATVRHHGDMTGIGESWGMLMERVVADGYRIVGDCREVYLHADGHVPGPDWVTELQVPVAR
ncbi:MerR family transcriptional regulator [Microbacterium aurantiacum]|uniref:MerR family transcriptional regulator n=2 Tax=Microbacterium aurantiacum TaxID=162393 RepID=UPI0040381D56